MNEEVVEENEEKNNDFSVLFFSKRIRRFSLFCSFSLCILPYYLGLMTTEMVKTAACILTVPWFFAIFCSTLSSITNKDDEDFPGWFFTGIFFIFFLIWIKLIVFPEIII